MDADTFASALWSAVGADQDYGMYISSCRQPSERELRRFRAKLVRLLDELPEDMTVAECRAALAQEGRDNG